jgi:Leucine-rich repeat (LRR) protein
MNELKINILELKNLQIIVLKRNQIHNIHYKAFEGLVHLEKIDLSVNQIQHIPLDLLCGLTNLKEFSIHHNKIKLIHEKLFNGLIALNEIDLSYNQINRISGKDIFRGLDNLREIYLNGNLLSFISIKTFKDWPT